MSSVQYRLQLKMNPYDVGPSGQPQAIGPASGWARSMFFSPALGSGQEEQARKKENRLSFGPTQTQPSPSYDQV